MEVKVIKRGAARPDADVLVVPYWKGAREAVAAYRAQRTPLPELTSTQSSDFGGEKGQMLQLYADLKHEPRLLLLGLGKEEEATLEQLRSAYASAVQVCRDKKLKDVNVLLPAVPHHNEDDVTAAVVEGLYLSNYAYLTHKKKSGPEAPRLVHSFAIIDGTAAARDANVVCKAVCFARDLVNGNADDVTPEYLAEMAKKIAKGAKSLSVIVFDKKRIVKEEMGLLLAVSRGSVLEPRFIIVEYRGAPKSSDRTVLVGKGVTYDTGGLSLKTATGMETMRTDMGGAAAVLATIKAASELRLKVNVVGVIPATENCIGSRSYKPGDVYRSYHGLTVEIGNTDAEGRLILADALAYAIKHLKPTRLIDLATLTGAINIALGDEVAGLMSNDDKLATALLESGEATYERLWRLPLIEDYKSALKSERADLRNVGGSGGGSIVAALFLQAFVDKTPWAHLDIAATRYANEAKRYRPKGATGFGVRLLLDYLKKIAL